MSRKVALFKKSKANTLIKEARSVESQQAIISKLRKAKTSEYKKFFKALIDELYIGNDHNNLVNFVEDFDACVNVLISDDEDCMSYFKLDTVVRDHFMDAYAAISSEKILENSDFVGEPTLDDIIDQIKSGQIKVKWDGWFFSGGRDWGDWDCYALYKGGKEIGSLDLGDNEVHVKLNDLQIVLETYNASTVNLIEKVLLSAVKRDDKAFIKKITGSDGKLYWPRDWADISRTEVFSGIWKPDEDMLGESVIFESDSSNDKYIVYTHDTKEEFDTFEDALQAYKSCSK